MKTDTSETELFESKTHLSASVEAACRGEGITMSVRGKPLARLVPFEEAVREDAITRLLANPLPMGMSVREAIDEGRV